MKNVASVDHPPIDSLFSNYYEEYLRLFPLDATMAGDNRYNDTLPDNLTVKYREQLKAFYTKYQNKLKEYDTTSLTEEQQMSYDILAWECEINLDKLKYPFYLTPIDQFWSLNLTIGQLAGGQSMQPFKTVKDYENWLKRVDDYMVWCDTAMANMRKGMKIGYVLPRSLIVKVLPQLAQFDHGPVDSNLFYQPVKLMPASFSDQDKKQIAEEYYSMVKDKVIPKYKELYDFMANVYLPAGRETSGISALPGTKGMYQFMIRYNTTTNMTPDQVFDLGKREVARITKEMEKVKNEVGFKGDLKAFFEYVRNDKALMPYTKPQQVIDHFNAIYDTMKPYLKRLFDVTPKTGFEVRRTEAFREKSASPEYQPGSFDGSRPGIFYVPIPDVRKYNIFSDEDLFLHEAIPGHHYQISLQQENKNLPKFRKLFWISAYGEGWALYCESLGKELGLYKNPYQYFGMLSAEMHRAIRLVVDVGLHAKGWTREEAIQYSLEHEADPESEIISEIERYMANPGQALSYKIGQMKILELRAKAEKELGNKFDIRKFHDEVLGSGCLPLFLLEKKIDNWIEKTKKAG